MYKKLTQFTASDSPAAGRVIIIVSYLDTIWFFLPFAKVNLLSDTEIRQAHNQNPPQSTAVEIFDKRMSF